MCLKLFSSINLHIRNGTIKCHSFNNLTSDSDRLQMEHFRILEFSIIICIYNTLTIHCWKLHRNPLSNLKDLSDILIDIFNQTRKLTLATSLSNDAESSHDLQQHGKLLPYCWRSWENSACSTFNFSCYSSNS